MTSNTNSNHYRLDGNMLYEEDSSLNAYVQNLEKARAFFRDVDPYAEDPMKEYMEKADHFLIKHAGTSYEDFLRQVKPETLEGNDYFHLMDKGLKKRLFRHRSRIYLSALHLSEEQGYNIEDLLEKILEARIHPIKKEKKEPTFDAIYQCLKA